MRVHRFKDGVCRKCGAKESFLKDLIAYHGDKFTQQKTQLIKQHPEKEDELLEVCMKNNYPCTMTDDELDIKDIIE